MDKKTKKNKNDRLVFQKNALTYITPNNACARTSPRRPAFVVHWNAVLASCLRGLDSAAMAESALHHVSILHDWQGVRRYRKSCHTSSLAPSTGMGVGNASWQCILEHTEHVQLVDPLLYRASQTLDLQWCAMYRNKIAVIHGSAVCRVQH